MKNSSKNTGDKSKSILYIDIIFIAAMLFIVAIVGQ